MILGFAILSVIFYSTKIVNWGLAEVFVTIKGTLIIIGTYYIQSQSIDDFTILAQEANLDWFKQRMESKYEIKHSRIGPGTNDNKTVRILNRVVEWTPNGITYEADSRHAEIIIRDNGLD